MDLGIQLFGVLVNTELPVESALSQIKKTGYTHVEPCLALDPIGSFEKMIWPLETFDRNMETITALGLKVDSVHIFGKTLNAYAQTLCELAGKWGIRAFVVKVPEEPTDLQLQETAIAWMTLADTLREAGAELLIHNEAADIAAKEGVILDPVYTGKAFYGLYREVKKGTFDSCGNILFIHTGGMPGLYTPAHRVEFEKELMDGVHVL